LNHSRQTYGCLAVDESVSVQAETSTRVARGVGTLFSSYAHLVKMLEQGWRIEPPVYVRPRWRSRLRLRNESTLHFVLWREDQVSLVSALDCPEIQQFLMEKGLPVDHL
jgi:hypothetical protein